MEFSQNVGCPENCHLKQDMMMNSESGFQIVRPQKDGQNLALIAVWPTSCHGGKQPMGI